MTDRLLLDRMTSLRSAALALITVLALTATACSGSATVTQTPTAQAPSQTTAAVTEPSPTPAPASTEAPTPPPPAEPGILDQELLDSAIADLRVSDGAVLVAVIDGDGNGRHASTGVDAAGNSPTLTDTFRVGSITKVFTALAVLTLVDDELVVLDAPANDYVSRVAIPDEVTVRHLLSHRSGIYNYTDPPAFFSEVLGEPDRVWTPEEMLEPIADKPSVLEPGSRFSYSNTNYMILGMLIEEVTGERYDQYIRQEILDPLELQSTYLAGFETGPEPFDPFSLSGISTLDYTSIATSAWAAGATVSSAEDLHRLFVAVFDNQVVSAPLVDEMTAGTQYGLGLQLNDWNRGLTGHNGGIPGYVTVVLHSPETSVTAFLASTERTPSSGILEVITNALADHAR